MHNMFRLSCETWLYYHLKIFVWLTITYTIFLLVHWACGKTNVSAPMTSALRLDQTVETNLDMARTVTFHKRKDACFAPLLLQYCGYGKSEHT